jgi:hypothetical protein
MEACRQALEDCELGDLGFVGDPFTWRNNWHRAEGYIRECLDRAVANVGWRCLFPLHKVINGDPRHSDHRHVIIEHDEQASVGGGGRSPKTFRFEARWLQEEQCEEVVTEAWNTAFGEGASSVGEVVKKVGGALSVWDREVLGELKQIIKRASRELEDCR